MKIWTDDFITEYNGKYNCWDGEGEWIAEATSRTEARIIIAEYRDIIGRRQNEKPIQKPKGPN